MIYAQNLTESTFLRLPKNNSSSFVPLIHAVVNVVFDESVDLDSNSLSQRLIVGTRNNQIFEIKLDNFDETEDFPEVNLQLIADVLARYVCAKFHRGTQTNRLEWQLTQ